ncbi:hypothetical protein Ahy_A10g050998 isoform A [Arachis hypogaea]|uniref:Uncharacterized protein n=1 Tax=Arachis hypogaea TaxID=3818 RepID=A0A445BB58_ARAHY|nr:hypothetical protein Ahy_A10g050998 isoform A [Arachis hypogaea]
MVRRYQRRKQEKISRENKKQIQTFSAISNKERKGSTKNTFNEGGSRFNVLYEERDDEMQENLQPEEAMHTGPEIVILLGPLTRPLTKLLSPIPPKPNGSIVGPSHQTRKQSNNEEASKVVIRKPRVGKNPQGPKKAVVLKIGPMLTKKGFKSKQKMVDKGSLSLGVALNRMETTAFSSSKNTDRELMEGVILDRMREVTKQQWEDYQSAKNSNRVSEANVNHNPLLTQAILYRETPVLTVEDEDGRGTSSEQPDTGKEGHKKSTKGKESMFHAEASEDMGGSA